MDDRQAEAGCSQAEAGCEEGIEDLGQVLGGNADPVVGAGQQDRFMVTGYPTELLLGPDGKIISMDVRGEKLAKLLEKLTGEDKASAETK